MSLLSGCHFRLQLHQGIKLPSRQKLTYLEPSLLTHACYLKRYSLNSIEQNALHLSNGNI